MNKSKKVRTLWYTLSAGQRSLIRRLYYLPLDSWDLIRGRRHKYVPPRGAIYTGSPAGAKDFIAQSDYQLSLLKNEIGLKPDDAVLDIGSGIGRTAISLTRFLNPEGSYEGFDVVKKGVDWCNDRIGRDCPNFNFTYIPLFNDLYNTAHLKAGDFVFPYGAASFDKIFSFSVFTHMQIAEIQNYLKEINRVLKKGGVAFSTFFLYENKDEESIADKDKFGFPVKKEGYRLMNDKVRSGNIAIHKNKLKEMMAKEDLRITKIIDGFWKGTEAAEEYQDIVVFDKK